MQELRERVAALDARFEQFEKYEHDRWHKLANDLAPLVSLPERLTREIGRLHGVLDGKTSTLSRDFERSIEAAIAKAMKPVSDDVAQLREDVEKLKMDRQQWTGAKLLAAWVVSTAVSIVAAFGFGHK